MSLEVLKVKNPKNKPNKLDDKLHPHLPRSNFIMLLIAPPKSGKSVLIANLLANPNFYNALEYWEEVLYVSPTSRYDKTTQHTFGNKDFVMNAIDYLIDENGVIRAKGKEVKLRPLNKIRTRDERTFWQILNIGLPVGLVLLFGFILQWVRRRNYGFID